MVFLPLFITAFVLAVLVCVAFIVRFMVASPSDIVHGATLSLSDNLPLRIYCCADDGALETHVYEIVHGKKPKLNRLFRMPPGHRIMDLCAIQSLSSTPLLFIVTDKAFLRWNGRHLATFDIHPMWRSGSLSIAPAGNIIIFSVVESNGSDGRFLTIGVFCPQHSVGGVEVYARIPLHHSVTHVAATGALSNVFIATKRRGEQVADLSKHTLLQALALEPDGTVVHGVPDWSRLRVTSGEMFKDSGDALLCTHRGVKRARYRKTVPGSETDPIDFQMVDGNPTVLGVTGTIMPIQEWTAGVREDIPLPAGDALRRWSVDATDYAVYLTTGASLLRIDDPQKPSTPESPGWALIQPKNQPKLQAMLASGEANLVNVAPAGLHDAAFILVSGKKPWLGRWDGVDVTTTPKLSPHAKGLPTIHIRDWVSSMPHAGVTGDPEIQTFHGRYWRLPNIVATYRLLEVHRLPKGHKRPPRVPYPLLVVNITTTVEDGRAYLRDAVILNLRERKRPLITRIHWPTALGPATLVRNDGKAATVKPSGEIVFSSWIRGCSIGGLVLRTAFGRTLTAYCNGLPKLRYATGLLASKADPDRFRIADLHHVEPLMTEAEHPRMGGFIAREEDG